MKILYILLSILLMVNAFAATQSAMGSSHNDKSEMNMSKMVSMMYMDIGAGVGAASKWQRKNNFAIDAMIMGVHLRKNLGAEVGMGIITGGTYKEKAAMINVVHTALKGAVPLTNLFSLYGKLGAGASIGHGMVVHDQTMEMINPTDAGLFYGAGLQFRLTEHFALHIDDSGLVVAPSSLFGSLNQVTLGIEIS